MFQDDEEFNRAVKNAQIQMRKGILEFCILHIISRGGVYSKEIIEELRGAKVIVVEGTLYPLLNRLRKLDLLTYDWKESKLGPPQKHYQLTNRGSAFLNELNETWIELVESTNKIITKNSVIRFHQISNVELEALKVRKKQ